MDCSQYVLCNTEPARLEGDFFAYKRTLSISILPVNLPGGGVPPASNNNTLKNSDNLPATTQPDDPPPTRRSKKELHFLINLIY